MSTGIGCPNCASALRRPSPIADGFALRCHNVDSFPLHHPSIRFPTTATWHPRDVTLHSAGPIAVPGRTANHQIPIAL